MCVVEPIPVVLIVVEGGPNTVRTGGRERRLLERQRWNAWDVLFQFMRLLFRAISRLSSWMVQVAVAICLAKLIVFTMSYAKNSSFREEQESSEGVVSNPNRFSALVDLVRIR